MTTERAIGMALALLVVASVMPIASAGAQETKDGKVKLEVKLPRPMFTGTPKNIRTPNLEPARKGKKRADFFVPKGTTNVAVDKAVTGSDTEPVIGELELITDGDKEGVEGSYVELGPGQQYVQIDLEAKYKIHAIVMWHYHSQARVYRDVIIQTANDPDFIMDVQTVYNNDHDNSAGLGVGKAYEYIETYEGRLAPVKGVVGRYVRLYSSGSTSNELNHYTEVEVFAQPTE
jgi:hypothetical protein